MAHAAAEELRVSTTTEQAKTSYARPPYLGEANTDALLYKLWQKMHDTSERIAQPDSHKQQPNAKPLAQ